MDTSDEMMFMGRDMLYHSVLHPDGRIEDLPPIRRNYHLGELEIEHIFITIVDGEI